MCVRVGGSPDPSYRIIGLLKIIQNKIGINKKEQVPPRLIVENNRGHFIRPQNIFTVKNIDRLDMHPPLLYIINMEFNCLNIVVTLLVVYSQDPQILFLNLQHI